MSDGQLVDDVNLALSGKMISDLHNRMGGNVPTALEICEKVSELYGV